MPAVSVKEIAEFLGAAVEGEGDLRLAGVKPLGEAAGDELSFLANPKYAPLLATTAAGAVLVPPGTVRQGGATFIRVADPYLSLARVVQRWFAAVPGPEAISPQAAIDDTASIGNGTRVGSFASIGANVTLGERVTIYPGAVIGEESTIGDDTVIYPNVTIYHRSVIGARCIVHSGAVIGADGYGFATAQGKHHKIPQIGRVRIGDDVEIGSNSTIDRAALGETVIGDGTKIDNLVQIAHNVKIGRHCLIVAQVGIAGSTEIGDYCVFGGQAGAGGHLKIGSQVQVAAKGTVMKDYDGPVTLGGFPARVLSEHMRVEAAKNRLPELLRRIREIEKKLELRPGSNENQG